MIGLHVTVPIACFRKGTAREYIETESIPPPATCYGFLLSLVGETDRRRHIGARVSSSLLNDTSTSVVLRTMWRIKKKPLGSPGNTRPDYQQLLTGASATAPFIELVIWLESSAEIHAAPLLEERVKLALNSETRSTIQRFGGLSLGESTHLVDEIRLLTNTENRQRTDLVLHEMGRFTMPVWVDHVGSKHTRYVTVELVKQSSSSPKLEQLPRILPPDI